jgi:invasion protein IalB
VVGLLFPLRRNRSHETLGRPLIDREKVKDLMSKFRLQYSMAVLGAFLLTPAAPALAQQSTTATYTDWVVQCVTQTTTPPQKICDMQQLTEVKGKSNPLSRIVVPHPVRGKPISLIIQLPVNVWLATGVKLELVDKEPALTGQFTHCIPAGCFAEIGLNDAAMKAFRTASKPGKLIFKNAGQHDIDIPVSFKGFGQAFDALSKD